ncbi:MAG: acetyl-CoA C-acyltransferase [Bacillota bacterium]|nr:acetyl-CoA C-acyltransferase [Bacillota bacterium]
MRDAVIVTAVRTPVGKAPRGSLRTVRPDELAALVVRAALERTPGLEPGQVDDVIMGCAFPEADQGFNIGRMAALAAGLPTSVPGMTVNRYCSSGLQAIALAASQVMTGMAEAIVAGGVESMSRVPMMGYRASPHPDWAVRHPEWYMAMGHTAEEVARRYGISREEQDAFALRSHRRAAAAIDQGLFREEIVPVEVTERALGPDGREVTTTRLFEVDEGVRRDTSPEALARLKPAFQVDGTVTAGNSSQTSDGAAAAVVLSDALAARLGLKPLAVFRGYAVAGVDPEVMGVGPVEAVPKALKAAGLGLDRIDLVELNEAFAAQSLAVIRRLGLDPERVNVQGGAIALGHPLGCTGAKLTATLLHAMPRRGARYGLVTMCIGGGMGAAGVFERVA